MTMVGLGCETLCSPFYSFFFWFVIEDHLFHSGRAVVILWNLTNVEGSLKESRAEASWDDDAQV